MEDEREQMKWPSRKRTGRNPQTKTKEKKDVKDAAMDFLRFRERSLLEIRTHLKVKEYDDQEIEEAIEFLVDCNIASDQRYCETYLRYGMEKGKGPIRLRHELRQKGIAEEWIQAGLEELMDRDQQREKAFEKAERILGNDPPTDKDLARIARRLASLGYESGVVYDVIRRLRNDD